MAEGGGEVGGMRALLVRRCRWELCTTIGKRGFDSSAERLSSGGLGPLGYLGNDIVDS